MKQRLLAMVFALFATQMAVWAQKLSGYCGDPKVNGGKDVKWELSVDSVLTISGVGAMRDYESWNLVAPWRECKFKSVVVEDGITGIGRYAFYDCYDFTGIIIGNSVTSIGDMAFGNCRSLSSVSIGNSVEYIGFYAFARCRALTSITLPNSVTSIGGWAFQECSALRSIIFGNSMMIIEIYVFENCCNLASVTCLSPVPPTLAICTFYGISTDATLRVPDVEAYKASDWAQYFSNFEQIDLTAISNIEADRNIPATIYDLSGRRVTVPVEGRIYVVNGKAVVW